MLLLIVSVHCIAQTAEPKKKKEKKAKEIELLHADRFAVDKNTPKGASKLIGNVRLKHDNALMFCDSAYLFDNNSLNAYGNVKIIDGDSLTMTGDSLFYDGNTKLARVRGRVKIDNKASILKTPFLDYYRSTSMAHYYGGGEIDSRKEEIHLTSDIGYYFSERKVFHFKGNVVMTHPEYVINTDTMHYAPDLEKTWFFGPTDIDSDDQHIYCEFGWFDQLNEKAQFVRNAKIISSGQILMGDTIDRDQAAEIGIARCNVSLIDTNEKFQVDGDYGIYHEKDSTSMITKNMMLMQDMEGDTFFLTADSLFSELDTAGNRVIRTYYENVFYKSDMQGACDSLLYHTKDSVIYLFNDPILWSDANQITADSIKLTMANGVIDKMFMDQNAFIIAQEDSIFFNQIKGRNMVGYFKDDALYKVDVFGNGETIYYPREEDNSMIGVNETKCSNMTIRIDSNEIKKISFYDSPTAVLTPTDDMPPTGKKLDDFNWRINERPTSSENLIELRFQREALKLKNDSISNVPDSLVSDSAADLRPPQNEDTIIQTENEEDKPAQNPLNKVKKSKGIKQED
ncbi:MAG: OstA-like protein [Salibacteraceae bacterium]